MNIKKIFYKTLLVLLLVPISAIAMQEKDVQEIWYEQGSPLYHKNFARTVEGYSILILSGTDQKGYFVRVIFFLEGPNKGSMIIDADDYRYEELRTPATDTALFEYLQQKYLEQNLPEKG